MRDSRPIHAFAAGNALGRILDTRATDDPLAVHANVSLEQAMERPHGDARVFRQHVGADGRGFGLRFRDEAIDQRHGRRALRRVSAEIGRQVRAGFVGVGGKRRWSTAEDVGSGQDTVDEIPHGHARERGKSCRREPRARHPRASRKHRREALRAGAVDAVLPVLAHQVHARKRQHFLLVCLTVGKIPLNGPEERQDGCEIVGWRGANEIETFEPGTWTQDASRGEPLSVATARGDIGHRNRRRLPVLAHLSKTDAGTIR